MSTTIRPEEGIANARDMVPEAAFRHVPPILEKSERAAVVLEEPLDDRARLVLDAVRILVTGKNGRQVWQDREAVRRYVQQERGEFNAHLRMLESKGLLVLRHDARLVHATTRCVRGQVTLPEYSA
jgi:hypothetical protein